MKLWDKKSRLEWRNRNYPTFTIFKTGTDSRYSLVKHVVYEGQQKLAEFKLLSEAKRYAQDILDQSTKYEV